MAKSCGPPDSRMNFEIRLGTIVSIVVVAGLVLNIPSRGDDKAAKSGSKGTAKAKAVAKANADDEATDDDALETDDDLTALVIPPAVLAKGKAADRIKFSQELRGLLMEGMTADGDSQAAARRHFEAAHRALADDPRAAYAYGISLLIQKKSKEALDQFRAAAQQSPAPFLPALQGTAWLHILRSDYTRGLPAVLDLARKIEETKEPWPTDHDRRHSAEWLGRMVGYLTGPGQPSAEAGPIEKLAGDIDKLLTRERKEAYEHGLTYVTGRYEKMKALATRPVEEVLAEAKQKRRELLAEAQAADADVKRLEDEIRDVKKPHDKQLADLSLELRTAAARHKKAARDMAEASEEVEALSTPQVYPQVRTTYRYRVPYTTMRNETPQERKSRETQLASARQRAQQAESSFDQTKQQMTDTRSQREQAETEFRQATADKRSSLTEARKKSRELAARVKDVEQGELTPEKIKSRATALETYVPLDPETEKNRLLATLKSPGAK